ncbi:MAG: hypothetical protein DMF05_09390 [Verrucomicrobia bacterium]|nr:MAG: hypothetical protein DMF05_09390 [Verrucomicrobiota bacterium]
MLTNDEITFVSALPRSGTSLMMKCSREAVSYGYHFESFAARSWQPGAVLSDFFHLFELLISLCIVEVGVENIVPHRLAYSG